MNVVFAMAKPAIWISRKNKAKGSGCTEGEQVMKGLLAARIRVEHTYYQTVDDLESFSVLWAEGGPICTKFACSICGPSCQNVIKRL